MKELQELDQLIINWSIEKGITNFEKQKLKFVEEVGEMAGEILKNDTDKLKLEIGDVYVSLVILRKMYGKDLFVESIVCDSAIDGIFRLQKAVHLDCYHLAQGYLQDICKDLKLDLTECVNLTYNKISERNGVTIDGSFFKDK
jgi:NTP pyrophosphatase (non-canonical NTP hydrolase)